jgi:hypothetical protein
LAEALAIALGDLSERRQLDPHSFPGGGPSPEAHSPAIEHHDGVQQLARPCAQDRAALDGGLDRVHSGFSGPQADRPQRLAVVLRLNRTEMRYDLGRIPGAGGGEMLVGQPPCQQAFGSHGAIVWPGTLGRLARQPVRRCCCA